MRLGRLNRAVGVVEYEHDDGTFSVVFDDGEVAANVPRGAMRAFLG